MSEPFSAVNRERIRALSRLGQAYLTANLRLTRIAGKVGASKWPGGTEN